MDDASRHPAGALALAAARTTWTALPAPVRAQAADLIVDTFAVMARGLTHRDYAPFVQACLHGNGRCTVIGQAGSYPPTVAAQVHGGAMTVIQLQDGHRMARGHPASHVLPVALAMAEETGADGAAFLSAFVGAYEACVRIGMALNGLHPDVHDAGTWSTVGATVAASMLLRLTPEQIADAIEGACALGLLPWSQTAPQGATMHHLYVGVATASGITAAFGAQAGLRGLPGTVERFFGPRAGAAFNPAQVAAGIGPDGSWAHFEMMNAYLKIHPTCAHLHGVNDAIEALIRDDGVTANEIASVDIAISKHAKAYDNPQPATELAARFSVGYSAAIAFVRGGLGFDAISPAEIAKTAVRDLAERIAVRHDPALDRHYPAGRPAVVTVVLKDGRRFKREVIDVRGDHTNPTTRAERRAKATTLLEASLGKEQAGSILSACDAVFAGGPLKLLTDGLSGR